MGVYESNLIESRFRFTYKSCQVEKPKMFFLYVALSTCDWIDKNEYIRYTNLLILKKMN